MFTKITWPQRYYSFLIVASSVALPFGRVGMSTPNICSRQDIGEREARLLHRRLSYRRGRDIRRGNTILPAQSLRFDRYVHQYRLFLDVNCDFYYCADTRYLGRYYDHVCRRESRDARNGKEVLLGLYRHRDNVARISSHQYGPLVLNITSIGGLMAARTPAPSNNGAVIKEK